jgi:hypothetical protein
MRFIEIRGNLLVPISSEENLLLEKVRGADVPLAVRALDQREQELARRLVHRGVLDRTRFDGKLCYIYNDLEDIWRMQS